MTKHIRIIAAAALVTATSHVFAQEPSAAAKTTANEVTVVGCVEREKDYRERMAKGKGGALGTGIGIDDEFVLTSVTAAPSSKAGKKNLAAEYSLTGKLEPEFVRQIGRQVEVVGTVGTSGDAKKMPRLTAKLWHEFRDYCPVK